MTEREVSVPISAVRHASCGSLGHPSTLAQIARRESGRGAATPTVGRARRGYPTAPSGWLPDATIRLRTLAMDARAYFELTDAITAAKDRGELESLRERLDATEMHPMERRVLERVLRSRVDKLRLTEIVVPRPRPERAD